jgi:hypothetical protein
MQPFVFVVENLGPCLSLSKAIHILSSIHQLRYKDVFFYDLTIQIYNVESPKETRVDRP